MRKPVQNSVLYPMMHHCMPLRLENVHLCLVSWNSNNETKATGEQRTDHMTYSDRRASLWKPHITLLVLLSRDTMHEQSCISRAGDEL